MVDVYVIATTHGTKNRADLMNSLMIKSSNESLVFGLEGVLRDEGYETGVLKAFGINKRGLFFGLEDEFPCAVSDIIMRHYVFSLRQEDKEKYDKVNPITYNERVFSSKLSFVKDIMEFKTTDKMLKKINPRVLNLYTLALVEELNKIKSTFALVPLELQIGFIVESIERKDCLTSNETWHELFRHLGKEIYLELCNLPEDERPNLALLEGYFDKSMSFEGHSVIEEFHKWKDKFLLKNMKEIVEMGIERNLPTYFLVGIAHGEAVSEGLRIAYPKVSMTYVDAFHFIPPEYYNLI